MGSLSYTANRYDAVSASCLGCVPLRDEGSGHCTVERNVATGARSADDSISYTMHQDTGTIKLTKGDCPKIEECAGMRPGAEWTGNWSRRK